MALCFFLVGANTDGFRLAYSNLILNVAPEAKRPVYVAVFNNITALGLFYSVPGGLLIGSVGFIGLSIIAIVFSLWGLQKSMHTPD